MIHLASLLTCVLTTATLVTHCRAFVSIRPVTSSWTVHSMLLDDSSAPSLFMEQYQQHSNLLSSVILSAVDGPPETGGVSYSKASYYTILGLYVLSFPGVWSQVKRSTSAKIKRKTFVTAGENSVQGKSLRQQAGEIMACTFLGGRRRKKNYDSLYMACPSLFLLLLFSDTHLLSFRIADRHDIQQL